MRAKTTSTLALGAVTDPRNVVSGAKVTRLRTQTGIKRADLAAGTGDYKFPLVNPGLYAVGVAAPGVKVETRKFPVARVGGG